MHNDDDDDDDIQYLICISYVFFVLTAVIFMQCFCCNLDKACNIHAVFLL